MITKSNKYNRIEISYQLAFGFSDPLSVSTKHLLKLNHIMIELMHRMVDTNAHIDVVHTGAFIQFSVSNCTDVPKLVNWLKTHSAKRLNTEIHVLNTPLWSRGYVLKSVGTPLNAHDCFELLSNKR